MDELIKFCMHKAEMYPELKESIFQDLCLCQDEIIDGGSPQHEIELCKNSVLQLIEDYEESRNS